VRDPKERLRDILEAISAIERHLDCTQAAFQEDELLQTWFLRHLQIIGEAARVLPNEPIAEKSQMQIDIDKLSESELIDLNHRVVARLNFLGEMRAHAAMLRFRIGDRVPFDPPVRPHSPGW
jgi:hypothetical protein